MLKLHHFGVFGITVIVISNRNNLEQLSRRYGIRQSPMQSFHSRQSLYSTCQGRSLRRRLCIHVYEEFHGVMPAQGMT